MTQVHIALARVSGRAATGSTMPAPDGRPLAAETVQAAASSAAAAIAAPDAACFWSVTAIGGAVEVAFGASPTAGEDPGWVVPEGQTRDFAAGGAGEKAAVRTVA